MDKKFLYLIIAGGGFFAIYYFFLKDSDKKSKNNGKNTKETGNKKPELDQDINISTPPTGNNDTNDYTKNYPNPSISDLDVKPGEKFKSRKNLKENSQKILTGKSDISVNTKGINKKNISQGMSNAPVNTGDITDNNNKNKSFNKSFDTKGKNINVNNIKKIKNKNKLDLKGRTLNN